MKHGHASLRDALLPAIGTNEVVPCLALSEGPVGTDRACVRTRAFRHADQWYISGEKIGVALARYANFALVLAQTENLGSDGNASLFAAPLNSDSMEIREYRQQAASGADFVFRKLRTPNTHMIGIEGSGDAALSEALDAERIHMAAILVGIGTAALRRAARVIGHRADDRRQCLDVFGHPLARAKAQLSTAWAATIAAATNLDKRYDNSLLATEANYVAVEACTVATDTAMQISSIGAGHPDGHLARYASEARKLRFAAVGGQATALNYIAQARLGLR